VYDVVVGPFFLCRAPADSEDFEGLTEEQVEFGKERFRRLEVFTGLL
jgi:hypothetical protein